MIRALNPSMGWAGPLVTQMLAAMPAVEVIKVEDTKNYDWSGAALTRLLCLSDRPTGPARNEALARLISNARVPNVMHSI